MLNNSEVIGHQFPRLVYMAIYISPSIIAMNYSESREAGQESKDMMPCVRLHLTKGISIKCLIIGSSNLENILRRFYELTLKIAF